jgi:hypothetical protein
VAKHRTDRHNDVQPVVVDPDTCCRMLAQDMNQTNEDIRTGKLESYLLGRRRRISVASIHRLVAERLANATPGEQWEQGRLASEVGRRRKCARAAEERPAGAPQSS